MRMVYRFDLPFGEVRENNGTFTLELPLGAIPLHVDVQQRAPHLPSMWVLVDVDEKRTVERRFVVVGTGTQDEEPPASKSEYIGTFQDAGFVWHIFEAAPLWPGEDANEALRGLSIPLEV